MYGCLCLLRTCCSACTATTATLRDVARVRFWHPKHHVVLTQAVRAATTLYGVHKRRRLEHGTHVLRLEEDTIHCPFTTHFHMVIRMPLAIDVQLQVLVLEKLRSDRERLVSMSFLTTSSSPLTTRKSVLEPYSLLDTNSPRSTDFLATLTTVRFVFATKRATLGRSVCRSVNERLRLLLKAVQTK